MIPYRQRGPVSPRAPSTTGGSGLGYGHLPRLDATPRWPAQHLPSFSSQMAQAGLRSAEGLTPTLSPQAGRGGIAWFGSVVSALNNAVSVIPLLLSVSLELTQKAVTAFDGGVECGLGLVFAGERRFEILGNDVADLHQIAETQPA
jgi:hypothetical protein